MPDQNPAEQPKIIIDSDWKSQAQAEKQRLAEEEARKKQAAAGGEAGGDDAHAPIGFNDLLKMLSTQALMYLGAFPDPQTGKAMVALDLAQAHIDLLGVLQDKTKGNLDDEEDKFLKGLLYELRAQYVEVSETIARMIQEGKISPHGGPGPAGMGGGPAGGMGGGMGGGGMPPNFRP